MNNKMITWKEYDLQNKIFNLKQLESWYYAMNKDMNYIKVHNEIGKLEIKLWNLRLKLDRV